MDPLRVGVVGVGHLGYHHARNYSQLEDAHLVGVVDTDADRASEVAREFGVSRFPDLAALIDAGIDAASVVVPTMAHAETTLALIEAGIHVMVEKPIAPTLPEAAAMVAAANRAGRILQVGHIERFNGAVIALLEAIREPKFIECHRLSPFSNRGDDVSVVLDLMIHDIDIVRALDTSDVVSVDANGLSVLSKYEDIANARIRFASGCVANITCSRISLERMRKIRCFSSDAYVSTDYSEQEVMVYRKKDAKLEPGMNPMELITIDPLPVVRDEPLKLELASFIDCVRNKRKPIVSGEDAIAALELAHEIEKTIRSQT